MVQRLSDGSVGAGAKFHIVEAFGGNPKHLLDSVLDVTRLDEGGIVLEVRRGGQTVARLQHEFLPRLRR